MGKVKTLKDIEREEPKEKGLVKLRRGIFIPKPVKKERGNPKRYFAVPQERDPTEYDIGIKFCPKCKKEFAEKIGNIKKEVCINSRECQIFDVILEKLESPRKIEPKQAVHDGKVVEDTHSQEKQKVDGSSFVGGLPAVRTSPDICLSDKKNYKNPEVLTGSADNSNSNHSQDGKAVMPTDSLHETPDTSNSKGCGKMFCMDCGEEDFKHEEFCTMANLGMRSCGEREDFENLLCPENQAKNEIQVMQFSKQIESHLSLIKEYRKENMKQTKVKCPKCGIDATFPRENAQLDNCIGSGTTAVACVNKKRNFIGMELSPEYYKIANDRLTKLNNGNDGIPPKPKDLGILPTII